MSSISCHHKSQVHDPIMRFTLHILTATWIPFQRLLCCCYCSFVAFCLSVCLFVFLYQGNIFYFYGILIL